MSMHKSKKKTLPIQHYYNLMMSQKVAYDISDATLSRAEVLWRKSISPYWKDLTASDISQEKIVDFINWHREHRKGIQLVNVFKYLGNIMQVMVESGALEIAQKPKLELPKDEVKHHAKQKGRYITDDEFQRILSKTQGWFKLYFLILYTSGFRKMELGKLTTDRLRKVENRYIATLTTEDTKTGRAREVPFSEVLTPLVDEQLASGSKYLFPSVRTIEKHIATQSIDSEWRRAKRNAGIDGKMRIHDCRHSCASNLAKDGISPIVSVTQLGMSLNMYQKTYLKLTAQDLFVVSDSSNKRLGKI